MTVGTILDKLFDNPAAVWSAIAASFAALSSILIMLIQRRNLLESARPELVVTGWGRGVEGSGDSLHEVLTFNTMRNVGRGAALNVIVVVDTNSFEKPAHLDRQIRIPVLACDETMPIDGKEHLWWNRAKDNFIPVVVNIYCWDTGGMRHETQYVLGAFQDLSRNEVAPGVIWIQRTTRRRAVWLLKLQTKLVTFASQAMRFWKRLPGETKQG